MRASYSRTFKIKAVKKALNRHDGIGVFQDTCRVNLSSFA